MNANKVQLLTASLLYLYECAEFGIEIVSGTFISVSELAVESDFLEDLYNEPATLELILQTIKTTHTSV